MINKKPLEILSAGLLYNLLFGLLCIGLFLPIVILYSTYWYISVTYLIWIWVIDRDTPEGVSRINNWAKSWMIFKYAANYFPVKIHTEPGFVLDPKRNYLGCSFPHGVLPTGGILGIITNACGIDLIMPNHTVHGITLKSMFYIPILRDLILALGLCSANAKSIERLLTNPGGGKVVGLIAGGSGEMFDSHSGQYRIRLKDRKGFIKLALRTGSPLMPVFSFGENSIYRQIVFSKESLIRRFQEWSKVTIGFPIIFIYGRGLFQEKFGFLPLTNPINVIMGNPIDVQKVENPTQEDIDALHKIFVKKLSALFEEYKFHYEPYPEKCTLNMY